MTSMMTTAGLPELIELPGLLASCQWPLQALRLVLEAEGLCQRRGLPALPPLHSQRPWPSSFRSFVDFGSGTLWHRTLGPSVNAC